MVRAIAGLAVCEAARLGESRASFRGFGVVARRLATASDVAGFAAVSVCVRFGGSVLGRERVRTIDGEPVKPMS